MFKRTWGGYIHTSRALNGITIRALVVRNVNLYRPRHIN